MTETESNHFDQNRVFMLKSRMIGDAFEFGFYVGLAIQEAIPTYRGIAINEPPFIERGGAQELKDFMERASEVTLQDVLEKLIYTSSKTHGIPIFKIYREKIQHHRTKKDETTEITEFLLNDDKTVTDILRLIKTGYQCSLSIVDFIEKKWNKELPLLEIFVESSLVRKRPDFMVIANSNHAEFEKDGIPRLLAIGDVKSFHSFVLWSKEKFLSEYIDQLIFDEYSMGELNNYNLQKSKSITISDFHKIAGALSKYLKIIKYCDLYFEKLKIDAKAIHLFIILPGAISTLEISSPTHLKRLLNFLRNLIPSEIRIFNNKTIRLNEDKKSYLFDLFYEEGLFIRKKPEGNVNTYTFSGVDKSELDYIFESEDFSFIESYPKNSKLKEPEIVLSTKNSTNFEHIRKNHNETFLNILRNNKYDVIINGSEQGIGKNYTLIEHLEDLIKEGKKFTILYLCPRIVTILQMKKLLETKLKSLKGHNVKVKHTFSQRDLSLILNRTYKHIEIIHKRAGEKIAEELRNDESKIILATSQALISFVKNQNNKNLLLSKANIIVFDELIASSPLTRRQFIDLLNLTKEYKKFEKEIPKLIVMDASITSSYLSKQMLSRLISDSKTWYFPFNSTYRKETNDIDTWESNSLEFCFMRHKIDFNIEYAIGSCIIGSKFMNKDCVVEVLPYIESLVRNSQKSEEFASLLKQGKVIFYVDNKQLVDALLEQLQENNYTAIPITSENPHIDEEFPKTNIIGTSSLAFGTSFPHHELLIILPPSISRSNYFETTRNIELFRQIVKRMRGDEKNDSNKHRLVILLSFLSHKTSITHQRINHFSLRAFVQHHLINKEYHVLASFSKSVRTTFGSKMSLYDVKGKKPYSLSTVSLDSFLRDYYPPIRNALNHFHMYLNLGYVLEFDTSGQWKDIPVPLFSIFKLSKQQIARFFQVNVYSGKLSDVDEFINYLITPKGYYSVEKGLNYLEMIVKSRHPKIEPDWQSKRFPYLLGFILLGKKNRWSLSRRIEKLLTPVLIHASNSFLLATVDITDDVVDSEDYEKVILRKLRSIGSPLRSVYFGDMELYEEPMRVIMTGKDFSFMTFGFIVSHPIFGTKPNHVKTLLSEALSSELVRENTLILPKIVKYLIS